MFDSKAIDHLERLGEQGILLVRLEELLDICVVRPLRNDTLLIERVEDALTS